MTRRFADFGRPRPAPWRWTDTVLVTLGSAIAVGAFVAFGLLFLLMHPAGASDSGQWENTDPAISQWYRSLMQPDNPGIPCCGEADAYWADEIAIEGDKVFAIITDDRADEPLRRPHIPRGTRIEVPKHKYKFDRGNPTGHNVIFVGAGGVFCFVQGSGA